jgi:hypothetical protein
MLSQPIDFLIKPTLERFNSDKTPHQQLSHEQIKMIVRSQFEALKEFGKTPWHHTLRLPKFMTLKIRYRWIRAFLGDQIGLARTAKNKLIEAYGIEVSTDVSQTVENIKLGTYTIRTKMKPAKNFEDIGLQLSQLNAEETESFKGLIAQYEDSRDKIFYWWALKNKWMRDYTSTPKYKRLQALRGAWQDSGKGLTLKEDYIKNRLTQIGQSDNDNEAYKQSIHSSINEDGRKGNKRTRKE